MIKTATAGICHGTLSVPASKSHTIRGLLMATLAGGTSKLEAPLLSSDALSCLKACQAMGANIERIKGPEGKENWIIEGTGGRISAPQEPIDVGNSGTTLYLAASMAALGTNPITFTGDEQICARPAGPLLNALENLGARVIRKNGDCAPFTIQGPLSGGQTELSCPTSQYLSSILLAAPLADGNTTLNIPLLYEQPYVEMTLKWLDDQFVMLENKEFKQFYIPGGQSYRELDTAIPGDYSSATFPLCAAAITGGKVKVQGLDPTDTQGDKDVIPMLEKMGCKITWKGNSVTLEGPEPQSQGGPGLTPAVLDLNATPDALPALAVTACYAGGTTELINVPQARLKETDRIAVMAKELSNLGASLEEREDGLIIQGGPLTGGEAHGHGDHRVVMALALAALGMKEPITIDTAEAVEITYPGYFEMLENLKQNT